MKPKLNFWLLFTAFFTSLRRENWLSPLHFKLAPNLFKSVWVVAFFLLLNASAWGQTTESITIVRGSFPSGALTYANVSTWSVTTSSGTVTGKAAVNSNTTQTTIQMRNSSTPHLYNEVEIPGPITKITIKKDSGTDRSFTPRLSSTNVQSSSTSIGGVNLEAKTVSTTTIWNVDPNDNYRYFYLSLAGGAFYATFIQIDYEVQPSCTTPTISQQPTAQSVTEGDSAEFSVTASGTVTDYQWQRSTDNGATWSNLPGETSASYTIPNASMEISGTKYRVIVYNTAACTVTSEAVTLTVTPPVGARYVTFYANGGTGEMTPQYGLTPAALQANSFTREGYSFKKWTTQADGSGEAFLDEAIYDFSADIDLYAQWDLNTYLLSFDANSGVGTMSSVAVMYNNTVVLPTNLFTKTGYEFLGWATTSGGSVVVGNSGSYTMPASDVTLYAVWKALPFSITYDGNGNTSGTMSGSTGFADGPVTLKSNAYIKVGYDFDSWNTLANGLGTRYEEGEVITMPTHNMTLYAQWRKKYTVTFYANGGNGVMEQQSSSLPAALTANTYVRSGYSFTAWNTAQDGTGTSYADGAIYTFAEDLDLYAQWIEVPTYELVTSPAQLIHGGKYILAGLYNSGTVQGSGYGVYIMSEQNTNNRAAVKFNNSTTLPLSIVSNVAELNSETSLPYEFELRQAENNWMFYDLVNEGYLAAASSGANHLKTVSDPTGANHVWKITYANSAIVDIVAQGDFTRNSMRFNSNNGSPLFSAYGSNTTVSGKVNLYKKVEPGPRIRISGLGQQINNGSNLATQENNTMFGMVYVGEHSVHEFEMENLGNMNLEFLTSPIVLIDGIDADQFEIVSQPTLSLLLPNTSQNFSIRFKPTSVGVKSAQVIIRSNDGVNGEFAFTIEGEAECTIDTYINMFPNTGPVGTKVYVSTVNNDLSQVVVYYNNVLVTPTSIDTDGIVLTIPEGAGSGYFDFVFPHGCRIQNYFEVITSHNTDCIIDEQEWPSTTDVLISEVFDKKTGAYGVIVLYNGTEEDIDLSDYKIERAGDYEGSYSVYANLTGTLNSKEKAFIVAVNPPGQQGAADNCAYNSTHGIDLLSGFNGNDGLRLTKNGVVIDDFKAPAENGYHVVRKFNYYQLSDTYQEEYWVVNVLEDSSCVEVGVSYASPPVILTSNAVNPACNQNEFTVDAIEGHEDLVGLTYQWYKNDGRSYVWQPIAGATNASLVVDNVVGGEFNQYYVRISEGDNCYVVSQVFHPQNGLNPNVWDGVSWSNGSVSPEESVIIEGDLLIDEDLEVCSLQIRSAEVSVASGKTLFIHDYLKVEADANLTLYDNANLVQVNDKADNYGAIVVERFSNPLHRTSYTYLSSPVVTTLAALQLESHTEDGVYQETLTGSNFKWENDAWVFQSMNGLLQPGRGYIVKAPNSARFPSTTNTNRNPVLFSFEGAAHNGIYSYQIPSDPNPDDTAYKLALIGNPYPSAISADKLFLKDTNQAMIKTIYLWDNSNVPVLNSQGAYTYSNSDYAIYNALGSTAICEGCERPTGYIASGQAFFVLGKNGGMFEIDNSLRYDGNQGYDNSNFYRLQNAASQKQRFWLNLKGDDTEYAETLIGYSALGTDELDELDATLMSGNTVKLYSILGANKLSIQSKALPLEQDQVIPLGYDVNQSGVYTIALGDIDANLSAQDIYLKDNLTGVVHDIKAGAYQFVTEQGQYEERFEIVFQNETMGVTPVDRTHQWVVVSNHGKHQIVTTGFEIKDVVVYDLLGREVLRANGVNANSYSFDQTATDQILLVKIITPSGEQLTKKIKN